MSCTVRLPDDHLWLRVTRPHHHDPFDPSFARAFGGRWNPPGSFDTLYLNHDLRTARLQLLRMLEDYPADVDDVTDDAYELVACRLPPGQQVLDVHTSEGVLAAGLPASYPSDADGDRVPHQGTQPVGVQAHEDGLDGVDCRSAATLDGRGREAAWWPRGRSHVAVDGGRRVPYGRWRGSHVTDASGLLEDPEQG